MSFEAAPAACVFTWPSENIAKVGMLKIPYFCASSLLSSTLTLTKLTLPSYSADNSSTAGETALQGPHHSAQKSTKTGLLELRTSCSNSCVDLISFMIVIYDITIKQNSQLIPRSTFKFIGIQSGKNLANCSYLNFQNIFSMKTKQTFGIAMIAALVMSVVTTSIDNAFAEKTETKKISSTFKGADFFHNVEGIVTVITHNDGSRTLQFGDNFKSTPGPDVYVYLATDDKASEFISLGKIKHHENSQEYILPEDVDLNKYDKVLIWCQAFGVLFGTADLPEYNQNQNHQK